MSDGMFPIDPKVATKSLSNALGRFFGKSADEIGELLGTESRYRRWKRGIRIVERAEEYARAHNRNISPADLKFLVPFLESASLEDDEGLQGMWARLLVEEGEQSKSEHRMFLDVMKFISRSDATFFKERLNLSHELPAIQPDIGFHFSNFRLSVENVLNERLLYKTMSEDVSEEEKSEYLEDLYKDEVEDLVKSLSHPGVVVFRVGIKVSPVMRGPIPLYIYYPDDKESALSCVRSLEFLKLIDVQRYRDKDARNSEPSIEWAQISEFGIAFASAVGLLD